MYRVYQNYTHFRKEKNSMMLFQQMVLSHMREPKDVIYHRKPNTLLAYVPISKDKKLQMHAQQSQWPGLPEQKFTTLINVWNLMTTLWAPLEILEAKGNLYWSHEVSVNLVLKHLYKCFLSWRVYTFLVDSVLVYTILVQLN